MMTLIIGLLLISALLYGVSKVMKSGFQHEDARDAAFNAAVETVIERAFDNNGTPVSTVDLDVNLKLNLWLEEPSERMLMLAEKEYVRLFQEEHEYITWYATMVIQRASERARE